MSSKRSKVEVRPKEAMYYDLMISLIFLGSYPRFIKKVIEKMDLKSGESILDLGSGTGKIEYFMVKKVGPESRILGLDISKEMISIAKKR